MTLRRRLASTVVLAALPLLAGVAWLLQRAETKAMEDSMGQFALAYMEAGGRERCERNPARFVFDTLTQPDGRGPRPPPERRGERPPWAEPPFDPEAPRPPRPPGGPDDPEGPRPRPPPGGERGPPPPDGARPRPGPPPAPGTRIWAYSPELVSANPEAPAFPPDLAAEVRGGAPSAGAAWEDGSVEGRRLALRMPWAEGPCAVVLVERASPPDRLSGFPVVGAAVVAGGLLLAILFAAGPIVRRVRRLTDQVLRSAESRYRQPVDASGSDEIAHLASAFNVAGHEVRSHLETVESRERTLRDFVANTTHDVMIPLTVLQGHLAKLLARAEEVGTSDPDTVRAAIEEAHYLGCLVQNLGTAAKLASDEVHLKLRPVDLGSLVERVAARHRPVARNMLVGIEFAVPPQPVQVTGDETLLEQAVSNAVHNAVRYNRAGGHVAIVLNTTRDAAPRFLLRVVDDGPGIPDAEMPRVLERGYRSREARTRSPAGAGLGLSIADDVVRRHGFEMSLKRSDYGGLEVVFSGPLANGSSG